jgi:hypothetical protein
LNCGPGDCARGNVGAAVGVGEGFARRTRLPPVLELVEPLAFAEVTVTALL